MVSNETCLQDQMAKSTQKLKTHFRKIPGLQYPSLSTVQLSIHPFVFVVVVFCATLLYFHVHVTYPHTFTCRTTLVRMSGSPSIDSLINIPQGQGTLIIHDN